MGSRWQKAKMALSSHLCAYVPRTLDDTSSSSAAESVPPGRISGSRLAMEPDFRPSTPTPSSSGLRLSKSSGKSSKRFCAICLGTMRPGHGHALFTAECSHIFHFHCIASNVKHGNQVCPICRSKWKEIPFQGPAADVVHGRSRINPLDCPQEEGWMRILHGMPLPRASPDSAQQHNPVFHASEPNTFNDDEPLDSSLSELLGRDYTESTTEGLTKTVEMKTYPEFPAVIASESCDSFTVLIHLKAPSATSRQGQRNHRSVFQSHHERAPVDLVTVLDVSGSMAGTKLALLKRAMGFVIQNLGPSDRLSVVAFSSTARRLFHLRRMTDSGRQLALQAVNSLTSSGGTNIAEGLRKGSKILEDRREKNPVCSIILLSDGQDTYNIAGGSQSRQGQAADYQSLLPVSIRRSSQQGQAQVPVHTFGFGADHDAASMHSISESSGGTFSFIEAENVIQDAFAQCIGGLLSVVVQELQVWFECTTPGVIINSVRSGSYASGVSEDRKKGNVDAGDLYAEEERDFLVDIQMPCCTTISTMQNEFAVLGVGCVYKDPVLQEHVNLDVNKVVIQRPRTISPQQKIACLEVDRQKIRLKAADAMAEARGLAEQGNLAGAVSVLGNQRKALSESMAAQGEDRLCMALDAELKEMQERMASRQVYEASGRAYVLSGLSSHSWQRATARGDSTDSGSSVHGYQTPSMVDMLMRSHTSFISSGGQRSRPSRPPIKPSRSCRGTLQAR